MTTRWRMKVDGEWATVQFDAPFPEAMVVEKHPEAVALGDTPRSLYGGGTTVIETPVPGVRRVLPVGEVLEQVKRSGYEGYFRGIQHGPTSIHAKVLPHMLPVLLGALERDERFKAGILFGLHRDVGNALIDYRSHTNEFGEGSLQFVIDKLTGAVYADVDKFSPYSDVVGFVGHAGEVVGHFWNRVFKRKGHA